MSITKYESSVKQIAHKCDEVYGILTDLKNMSKVRDYFADPEKMEALSEHIPTDKIQQISDTLKKMSFYTDSVRVPAPPLGDLELNIIERDVPKLVKFELKGTPVEANLWIQLLPQGENACKMKVTAGAELNFFIKGMANKYAPAAVERIADMLASIPYDKI